MLKQVEEIEEVLLQKENSDFGNLNDIKE